MFGLGSAVAGGGGIPFLGRGMGRKCQGADICAWTIHGQRHTLYGIWKPDMAKPV
jgi:hypothetical protein